MRSKRALEPALRRGRAEDRQPRGHEREQRAERAERAGQARGGDARRFEREDLVVGAEPAERHQRADQPRERQHVVATSTAW